MRGSNRGDNGKFTRASNPYKKSVHLRLSETLDEQVKIASEGKVTDWIRQAVIEKLEREAEKQSA